MDLGLMAIQLVAFPMPSDHLDNCYFSRLYMDRHCPLYLELLGYKSRLLLGCVSDLHLLLERDNPLSASSCGMYN